MGHHFRPLGRICAARPNLLTVSGLVIEIIHGFLQDLDLKIGYASQTSRKCEKWPSYFSIRCLVHESKIVLRDIVATVRTRGGDFHVLRPLGFGMMVAYKKD